VRGCGMILGARVRPPDEGLAVIRKAMQEKAKSTNSRFTISAWLGNRTAPGLGPADEVIERGAATTHVVCCSA
jgi:hypothetical protein